MLLFETWATTQKAAMQKRGGLKPFSIYGNVVAACMCTTASGGWAGCAAACSAGKTVVPMRGYAVAMLYRAWAHRVLWLANTVGDVASIPPANYGSGGVGMMVGTNLMLCSSTSPSTTFTDTV